MGEVRNGVAAICLRRLPVIGPILWGHSSPLCHALPLSLWTSILHCHSPGVATVARRLRYSYSWLRLILVVKSTVASPGEWQCKIRTGGVRRLAVANGPNIFQMLLLNYSHDHKTCLWLQDAFTSDPAPYRTAPTARRIRCERTFRLPFIHATSRLIPST